MRTREAWMLGTLWTMATGVIGWNIGELQALPFVALVTGTILWLFVTLWRGSTLWGAILTFGVPAVIGLAGAYLFAMGSHWIGYALMIGSPIPFAMLSYWVLTRWSSGKCVLGDGLDGVEHWERDEDDEKKNIPVLPFIPANAAFLPFPEFKAMNPRVGHDDR